MLNIGTKAPNFSLPDQNGATQKLSDYKGKWVLLYFYPKDMTPGCTVEACAIRDAWSEFGELGAVVLGVSKDSAARHAKFAEKEKLPFTLISDESGEMINAYEAMGEKSMFGKKYLGIKRVSYLIDPQGKIAKVYAKVKPADHAEEVLRDLRELAK